MEDMSNLLAEILGWSDPEQGPSAAHPGLNTQLMVPETGHTVPVQFLQTGVVCEA